MAGGLSRISVVIPPFNQSGFRARALDSLSRQEYPGLEVIVVDGGSSGGAVDLLKSRADVATQWGFRAGTA
jgi:glycosyltransferase involved in cell wall biosynthesis